MACNSDGAEDKNGKRIKVAACSPLRFEASSIPNSIFLQEYPQSSRGVDIFVRAETALCVSNNVVPPSHSLLPLTFSFILSA